MSERWEVVPGRGRVKVSDDTPFYSDRGYQRRETPYERTKRQVYATGNKWAIENFNATH